MSTIIVGDLHGRIDIAEKVLKLHPTYDIVFIGDYLDSYDRSVIDQVELLLLVLHYAETQKGVTALMGNHERSYLFPQEQCSGYRGATAIHVIHLRERMLRALKEHHWVGKYLVSHAGVSHDLLLQREISLEEYLEEPGLEVGYARGGVDFIGGKYWCDWFEEFVPIPDVPQVVGHTGYRPSKEHTGILKDYNSYNVDCLQYCEEVLLINDNGEAEILDLTEL